jgi:hypothetical protein
MQADLLNVPVLAEVIKTLLANSIVINSPYDVENWFADNSSHSSAIIPAMELLGIWKGE